MFIYQMVKLFGIDWEKRLTWYDVQVDRFVGELADPVARHEADVHPGVLRVHVLQDQAVQELAAGNLLRALGLVPL